MCCYFEDKYQFVFYRLKLKEFLEKNTNQGIDNTKIEKQSNKLKKLIETKYSSHSFFLFQKK